MVSILSACTCGIRPSKAAECATSLPYGRVSGGVVQYAVPPRLHVGVTLWHYIK